MHSPTRYKTTRAQRYPEQNLKNPREGNEFFQKQCSCGN
jgi:hypothetical protein